MPTYDYKCIGCNKVEEFHYPINKKIDPQCIDCFRDGKEYHMVKLCSCGAAIHFKGSGFYETDYKGK
jgi:predicted nucleic acid-binding Zn ribbon protein